MIKLIYKKTQEEFTVYDGDDTFLYYRSNEGAKPVEGMVKITSLYDAFHVRYCKEPDDEAKNAPPPGALGRQVDGNHYLEMGDYQPWHVLQHWLTAEEFRGYMKGTAIAYLARERAKGKDKDIEKAAHTLQAFLEKTAAEEGPKSDKTHL